MKPRTWILISGVKLWLFGEASRCLVFGLPTGGKGHGGDEEDFLAVRSAQERLTRICFGSWRPGVMALFACFRGALKRGSR
jgi:hypothetical protein